MKNEIKLPFDDLKRSVTEPILDDEIQESIEDAITPFVQRHKWRAWGMHLICPSPGGLLLCGPSGVGKTTIAESLAKKIGHGIVKVSLKNIGGELIGETERNVSFIFNEAKSPMGLPKPATIFLDECDGLLWSREHMSKDTTWHLGVIGTLLQELEQYTGFVILATNMDGLLDPALERRVVRVDVGCPNFLTRIKLWDSKIPTNLMVLSEQQLKQLAKFELTGAQIEKTIIAVAKTCIRRNIKPNFKLLLSQLK